MVTFQAEGAARGPVWKAGVHGVSTRGLAQGVSRSLVARGPRCQLYADAANSARRRCLDSVPQAPEPSSPPESVIQGCVAPDASLPLSRGVCSLPGPCAHPAGPARDSPVCLPAAELNLGVPTRPRPWSPL